MPPGTQQPQGRACPWGGRDHHVSAAINRPQQPDPRSAFLHKAAIAAVNSGLDRQAAATPSTRSPALSLCSGGVGLNRPAQK